MEKAIVVGSQGREQGMYKEIMTEVAAPRRGRYLQNHTTINPWGRDYITSNLLICIWPDAHTRMTSRRMMPSFSSSSFVALTTTTATDNAEALTKDGLEEEAADGTAGPTDSLTPSPRRTEEVAPPPPPHHHQSSSMSLNNQQTYIAAIDK